MLWDHCRRDSPSTGSQNVHSCQNCVALSSLDMNHQSLPLSRCLLFSFRVKSWSPLVVPVCLERWCLAQRQRAFCGRTLLCWSPLPHHQAALSACHGSEPPAPFHHQSTLEKRDQALRLFGYSFWHCYGFLDTLEINIILNCYRYVVLLYRTRHEIVMSSIQITGKLCAQGLVHQYCFPYLSSS